ncbi:hypothetical protein ACWDAO_41550, partial [Streptomyces sp. NPDC001212]
MPHRNSVAAETARDTGSGHVHDRCAPAAAVRRRTARAVPAAARPSPEARSAAVVSAALVAGLLAGYGIAVPVGAVATHLVTLTARTSLRTHRPRRADRHLDAVELRDPRERRGDLAAGGVTD